MTCVTVDWHHICDDRHSFRETAERIWYSDEMELDGVASISLFIASFRSDPWSGEINTPGTRSFLMVNGMKIDEKLKADIVIAMKDHDEHRLTTLRTIKSALETEAIKKCEVLTDAEETQILTTLIKQLRKFVEASAKEGRPELAESERLEIGLIEAYLPQGSVEKDIRKLVHGAIAHLQKDAGGVKPGSRDLGTAMQVAQQWIRAAGLQADRKLVSELVKAELAKEPGGKQKEG